jgi:hypothetical protein
MRTPSPAHVAATRQRSELAVLVETEARLDRALADAHAHAHAMRDAARRRADEAAAGLETELTRARRRIATEIETATAARVREIGEAADAEVGRYEAVRDERLDRIARRVAERLVELVAAEAP